MTRELEVDLLGPVRVRLDGRDVRISGVPQRAIVARLALAAGREVAVTDLIDALWSDEPPANAVGNLHSYVSRLRRAVGSDLVRRGPAGYRLEVPRVAVDVGRAEDLVTRARTAAAEGDLYGAIDHYTAALGLWRGEPLSDLPDPSPFAGQLAWLAEWRRQVTVERLQCMLDAGRATDALPELEHLIGDEPLREPLVVLLIRARHRVGRTAQALEAARSYRRRLADELGLDAGTDLADMERRILADDPRLRVRSPPRARPAAPADRRPARPTAPADRRPARYAPTDRFVGRRRELARVAAAVRTDRAVTVVGPGGIGKTRLVLEFVDTRPFDDVHVVELTAVSAGHDVAAAVADRLGLRDARQGVTAAIADRLGDHPALLVLDNCEHVREPVRELVATVLGRCGGLRLLATSRQRLGVPGERVVRLGPLPPDDQVTLFVDRASRLRGDFAPSDTVTMAVRDIGRLVDGLPLGIELAARREAVFGVRHLRNRLSAGIDVLEPVDGGARTTALRAAVEWSYRLLDPDARLLFDRLAVCHGFGPEALDHLAPPGATNPAALLAELVEASLVVARVHADPPRYHLLETMRHVGLEHLSPEQLQAAHDAHDRWMRAHANDLFSRWRDRAPGAATLLHAEVGNLRDALTRAGDGDADGDEQTADFALVVAAPWSTSRTWSSPSGSAASARTTTPRLRRACAASRPARGPTRSATR